MIGVYIALGVILVFLLCGYYIMFIEAYSSNIKTKQDFLFSFIPFYWWYRGLKDFYKGLK